MSGSLNKATLIGHLGKNPEIRTLGSGDRVANLSLATEESWRDKQSGERKSVTEWHRITIFNEGLVKVSEDYLKKGMLIYLEGQIKTRKWTDQQGVEKYSTEIVLQRFQGTLTMLESKKDSDRDTSGGSDAGYDHHDYGGGRQQSGPRESFSADLDDEIPF